jgi:hypothetical protein
VAKGARFLVCLVLTSCWHRDSIAAGSEMAAVRRIQLINSMEAAFHAEHGRFGSTEELGLQHPRNWYESGYLFTLQTRRKGYVIQARPRNYPTAGRRSYYSDETLVIHQAWKNGCATASDQEFR